MNTLSDKELEFNANLMQQKAVMLELAKVLARKAFQVVEDNPRTTCKVTDEIKALRGLVEAGEAAKKALNACEGREAIGTLFIHS